jgi:N-acetyl-anhydromuramyl-L-alanine amidase AmpD
VMQLIQAKNYTPAQRTTARLVVLHTMEAPEKPSTALAVAKWFAGPSAPQASAHFCVDAQAMVQCVLLRDVAWGAPGANNDGIHVEHAGFASQNPEQWLDDYSRAVLDRSSFLVASLCARFGIPARKLSVEEVRDKKTSGICGHNDVSLAFGKSTHTDPGNSFPWDAYVAMVEDSLNGQAEPFPLPDEEPVA